jgi:hypothetical protein
MSARDIEVRQVEPEAFTNSRIIGGRHDLKVRAVLGAVNAGQFAEASATYEALLARLKADLLPTPDGKRSREELLDRWRALPHVDPVQFRADVDAIIDSSL